MTEQSGEQKTINWIYGARDGASDWSRVMIDKLGTLYLSENVIAIVQNSPVFSNTLLNGASKKTDFNGNLDNDESYDQS